MTKTLLLVCDDAGFAAVDRGIRMLADETGLPVCAEYLIEQDGAADRARDMASHPLVSIGLHFELSNISDADRVTLTRELADEHLSLGETPSIQKQATEDAIRQLTLFRNAIGRDPAHISTHGNFNVDTDGVVMPWWLDLMNELFAGTPPPMQLLIPHVRHNLYSWNKEETKRPPRSPEEFAQELRSFPDAPVLEFVMHPALPEPGDANLNMLFTAEMRIADLVAAIGILKSGIIEREGFQIAAMHPSFAT